MMMTSYMGRSCSVGRMALAARRSPASACASVVCVAGAADGDDVVRGAGHRDVAGEAEALGVDEMDEALERIGDGNVVAGNGEARPRQAPLAIHRIGLGERQRLVDGAGDHVDAVQRAVL